MFAILRVETNAVGYWREGEGFVSRVDDATLYFSPEEARLRAEVLRRAETWQYLIRGAKLFVILA